MSMSTRYNSHVVPLRADFCLPPMGPWWQYAVPMFPTREHHTAARVIQAVSREILCNKWALQAKKNEAGKRILSFCASWLRNRQRKRYIQKVVRMHLAKREYDSRMASMRCSREARGKASSSKLFQAPSARNGKVRVPAGSCALIVSCQEFSEYIGKHNDLVMVVNPRKLRVENLYHDLGCVIKDDFTLAINGVALMPSVFSKKLNCIGVFPGDVYRVSVLR